MKTILITSLILIIVSCNRNADTHASNEVSNADISSSIDNERASSYNKSSNSSSRVNQSSQALSSSYYSVKLDSMIELGKKVSSGDCFTYTSMFVGIENSLIILPMGIYKTSDTTYILLNKHSGYESYPTSSSQSDDSILNTEEISLSISRFIGNGNDATFEKGCDTLELLSVKTLPGYFGILDIINEQGKLDMYYDPFGVVDREYYLNYSNSDSMIYFATKYAASGYTSEDIQGDTIRTFDSISKILNATEGWERKRKQYVNNENILTKYDGHNIYEIAEFTPYIIMGYDPSNELSTNVPGEYNRMIYMEDVGLLYYLLVQNVGESLVIGGAEYIAADPYRLDVLCNQLNIIKCK